MCLCYYFVEIASRFSRVLQLLAIFAYSFGQQEIFCAIVSDVVEPNGRNEVGSQNFAYFSTLCQHKHTPLLGAQQIHIV
jgi:hypothetical protein